MTSFTHAAIPVELNWLYLPAEWKKDTEDRLIITAGERTNWFADPAGTTQDDSAPAALFAPPDKEFILSARVKVDFASAFDAGVLQIRAGERLWAKLCFECSPQLQPMVVSVVTRGSSDDCNSVEINGQVVFLRIAVTPNTMAFHYSLDGRWWHFVRYFTLGAVDQLRVGFSTQAPTGKKCTAEFSDIHYRSGVIQDLRGGE